MGTEVVFSFSQFEAAVTSMDVDTIILGADIELESGIIIPSNKPSLTFDGMHEDVVHRLTDTNSVLPTETLRVAVASSISLTFKNMNITGRNYYGIPYIADAAGLGDVKLTYSDITYEGPQLVHNAEGLTHFNNCDITILDPPGTERAEEVAEVRQVEFEGNNTILHTTLHEEKATFYFRAFGIGRTATFTLLPNAKLVVDSNSYFMYNALYPVAYELQPGASFSLKTHRGISLGTAHAASSFLVDTNASFRYIQEAPNDGAHSIYINGNFTVNTGGSVYMQGAYSDSSALIFFPGAYVGSLYIHSPKSFVLYKPSSAPVAWDSSTSRDYEITNIEQLNHWITALNFPEAGTFADHPQNYWHNANWGAFSMDGSAGSGGNTATAHNLSGGQISTLNFQFSTAEVISAGSITIAPDPITDDGRPITGLTEPDANLIISFTAGGTLYTVPLEAGPDGRFEFDPEMLLPVDTEVTFEANTPFLIKSITATVVPEGEVAITSAPTHIVFKTPPISTNPVLLRRQNYDAPVVVTDTRPYPYQTQWTLLASSSGPFMAASGEVLENAVVFKDADGALWDISDTPVAVYTGGPSEVPTDASWDEDKGILVRVTGSIRSGVEYTTQLIWALEVAEEP